MKVLFSVLLAIASFQIQAKCMSGAVYIHPAKSLQQNSCLLIEGFGIEQEIIDSLNTDFPVYLESENNHRVGLRVKYRNKGQFRINQAILQPEQTLIEGETYALKVDNLEETKEGERPRHFWNPSKQENSWVITSVSETRPLAKLLVEPKLVNKSTKFYGCGTSINAQFEFITDNDSDYLIETELVDLDSNQSTLYYLKPPKDGLLSIGHSMCSGAFNFRQDHHYKIRFNIINSCNDAEAKWTNWIEFDSPFESYKPKKIN